jgi:hypothetical protein
LGSYDAWRGLVASAIRWLGEADVTHAFGQEGTDPERDSLDALLTAWEATIGLDKRLGVKDVLGHAEHPAATSEEGIGDIGARKPSLADAITAICPPKGPDKLPKATAFSKRLGDFENRPVGGRRLRREKDAHTKNWLCWVERVEGAPARPVMVETAPPPISSSRVTTYIAIPRWMGSDQLAPEQVPLAGQIKGNSVLAVEIMVDPPGPGMPGKRQRIAINVGDIDRAIEWATALGWAETMDGNFLVGFKHVLRVTIIREGSWTCVVKLQTVRSDEDLQPREFTDLFIMGHLDRLRAEAERKAEV